MRILSLLLALVLSIGLLACEPQYPKRVCKQKLFDEGDKVTFIKTNEAARVVGVEYILFGNDGCKYTGQYKIRLPDGAEIAVSENQIK